jgi:arylsulfatase A-like enzyme
MMIRHPGCEAAGTRSDALCYNVNLTATVMSVLNQKIAEQMHGIELWPAVWGAKPARDHVTVTWSPEVTSIDDRWWRNAPSWGENPLLYDLRQDPELTRNVAADYPEVVTNAVESFRRTLAASFLNRFVIGKGRPAVLPPANTPSWEFSASRESSPSRAE